METKINVAAIMKNKPQGTKLYDWLHNLEVELDEVATTEIETVVWCTKKDEDYNVLFGYSRLGTLRGWFDGLQILFPSKEMRDWSKFAWKKGDILVNKDTEVHIIFDGFKDDTYKTFHGQYYLWEEEGSIVNFEENEDYMQTSEFNKANTEDAQKYIHKIEKRLGGKLNRETLEIEKQPEFKDGDIVVYGESVAICRRIYKHTLSFYVTLNDMFGLLFADEVESSEEYRFATDEDKQQLFDALAKEGKAWDAEKKQIVDLKPKCEFKPFDRCIWKIRNCEGSIWQASFVSYVDEYGATPMGMSIDEDLVNLIILPYNDQTKLLVGTTDEWEGGEQ
jgi:hypothetical protein